MRNRLLTEQSVERTNTEDIQTFNVSILYDDSLAGHRAMRTITRLADVLAGQVGLKIDLWRFDLLRDPEWFALALADSINADVLVLSLNNAENVSGAVEEWLKLTLARKLGTRSAVVALLGSDSHLGGLVCERLRSLQEMTGKAGLDFFAPGLEWANCKSLDRVLTPAPSQSSNWEMMPRWGINE